MNDDDRDLTACARRRQSNLCMCSSHSTVQIESIENITTLIVQGEDLLLGINVRHLVSTDTECQSSSGFQNYRLAHDACQ